MYGTVVVLSEKTVTRWFRRCGSNMDRTLETARISSSFMCFLCSTRDHGPDPVRFYHQAPHPEREASVVTEVYGRASQNCFPLVQLVVSDPPRQVWLDFGCERNLCLEAPLGWAENPQEVQLEETHPESAQAHNIY